MITFTLLRRAPARHFRALAILSAALASPVLAQGEPGALGLDEAAQLAVTAQPLLEAQRLAARGARASAVAAGQLPDPLLVGGVTDLVLGGPQRFTLEGEGDTQLMLGVKQSFPAPGKRRLLGARGETEAELMDAELREQQRMVRREASFAWLEAWMALASQRLVEASIVEAQRQEQAVDIAYRASRASQAELMASRVAVELLNDELANRQQQEWHARNQLRRWIGAQAERPIAAELPQWPAPDLPALLQHLERHPHVVAQDRAVQLAQVDLDLARKDYRPDWSVQLAYGYRTELEDMASLEFEIGLPLFTAKRQDRAVEGRRAEVGRAEQLREDWLRQHRAHVELNVADWVRLQQRFERFDTLILPQAQRQLDSSLAAYASGSASLLALLEARRSLLEIRMQRLELQLDAARHQLELQYFRDAAPEENAS
jgi:cobalt-zinc-cadmium efflux system outer membrane protein